MFYQASDKSVSVSKLDEKEEKYRVDWSISVDGIGTFCGEEVTDSVFEIPKIIHRTVTSILGHIKAKYIADSNKLREEYNRLRAESMADANKVSAECNIIRTKYMVESTKIRTEYNRIADKGNNIIVEIAKVWSLPLADVQNLPRIPIRKTKESSPPAR